MSVLCSAQSGIRKLTQHCAAISATAELSCFVTLLRKISKTSEC